MEAVAKDKPWKLINRTDGVAEEISAQGLIRLPCRMAMRRPWSPIRHHDQPVAHTPRQWSNQLRTRAANTCSRRHGLQSRFHQLMKFYDSTKRSFDVAGFEHAIDIWTIVLEISVLMAAFPSQSIAEKSYRYRTLGLGYANLGAMLMQAGVPYDSEESRAICGAVTSILTGRSYA